MQSAHQGTFLPILAPIVHSDTRTHTQTFQLDAHFSLLSQLLGHYDSHSGLYTCRLSRTPSLCRVKVQRYDTRVSKLLFSILSCRIPVPTRYLPSDRLQVRELINPTGNVRLK